MVLEGHECEEGQGAGRPHLSVNNADALSCMLLLFNH